MGVVDPINEVFKPMLDDFEEIVMPMMIEYLKNTTIIIMSAEGTTGGISSYPIFREVNCTP